MKVIRNFINHVKYARSSRLLVVALFIVLSGIIIGTNFAADNTTANATTCSKPNDIIYCGFNSVGDFVNKYKANATGDLGDIYSYFGLAPSEIDRFSNTAQSGTIYKNGNIVLNGKTVATNAHSLGRASKSYSTPVNIAGKTYYMSSTKDVFLNNSLPALIMMNGDQFEFATLAACGNPASGTPTGEAPSYSCNMLNTHQINRTTFSYTTDTTTVHGATLAKLVYEFGDGQTKTVTSNFDQAVTHEYSQAGDYTTKVTVYVTVNGETKTTTSAECAKKITVKPAPTYTCSVLTPTIIDKNSRQYRFTVTTEQSGGATLKRASFNFGDNQSANDIQPSNANTVSVIHTYSTAGSYTVIATVDFNVADGVQSVTCQTEINPPHECLPGIPVGDDRCKPPKECKPGIPVGDSRCYELPHTGPVENIATFLGLGALIASVIYYVRSRRFQA